MQYRLSFVFNNFVVGLSGAVLLMLLSTREVNCNPPVARPSHVAATNVFTSSVLNNKGSKALGGTVCSNKVLDRDWYV